MNTAKAGKAATRAVLDTFESLTSQTVKPMFEEGMSEIAPFFAPLHSRPQELAQEDLKRAREEKKIEEMKQEEEKKSKENIVALQNTYRSFEQRTVREQQPLKEEFVELRSEVAKLAKSAGVDTRAHLEQAPKKIGILDIKRLTAIVRLLRVKADEAKSAKELVAQRQNSKPPTGMLAWVSGKQMKIHEQGTLQLQG